MTNEELLRGVNEKRSIMNTVRDRKVNWIGHILIRNCFLRDWVMHDVIEESYRRLQTLEKMDGL